MPTLTPAQLTTLRTAILADPILSALPNTYDAAADIAAEFNKLAAPDFIVYKTSVSNEEIGDAMNGTEIAGLSSLNMQRAQMLANYSDGYQNPSRDDRRGAFDQIFSGAGGQITRAALAVLWKRKATRFEKLYATGNGTDASPAKLVLEGDVDYVTVYSARNP